MEPTLDGNESAMLQGDAALATEQDDARPTAQGLLRMHRALVGFLPRGLMNSKRVPATEEAPNQRPKPAVDLDQFGPKVYFSNERTFLCWLGMSVTISSISALVLAFASETSTSSQAFGIVLLSISIAFCVYSLFMFRKRTRMLKRQASNENWDDRSGPVALALGLGACLIAAAVSASI